MIGRILLHYEVLDKLGSGGMGVVYRARDTKLGREIAIKVLPESFSEDKERLARFEREARLLASLNHPNIATIHGLEESGEVHFLVMELVPGETLAERIKSGPIPLEEALLLFKQIAGALEAAHEGGIVHRDLKPANIKITPDGSAIVLDFGLAKALSGETTAQDLSESPTFTREGTTPGTLLGTARYMSPEQARGKPVDKRADIWAYGCCLYEALTGKAVFLGETISDTIASVLHHEPDWQLFPEKANVLRSLLRRCLQKDEKERLHDIADARIEIAEALTAPSFEFAAPITRPKRAPVGLAIMVAVLAAILGGVAAWSLMPQGPQAVKRFPINIPATYWLDTGGIALSPDGMELVYIGNSDGILRIYRRSMDQLDASPIGGAEGKWFQSLGFPFFSLDGQWVGFFADDKLKKISLAGGPTVDLCDAGYGHGAGWGPDDTITFASQAYPGLMQVPGTGGEPRPITTPDIEQGEQDHRWPEILPKGNKVLFTVWYGSVDTARIAVKSLETGEQSFLIDGTNPRYSPTGHIVFAREESLWAVPFDVDRLEVTGSPTPLLQGNSVSSNGLALFALGGDGSLVYTPSVEMFGNQRELVWVDREGRNLPLVEDYLAYDFPRLSPDNRRLAVLIEGDIWVYDLERGTRTRLTFGGGNETPVWTKDGERVTFSTPRNGIDWKRADGSDEAEPIVMREHPVYPHSYSPDGKALLFYERKEAQRDIWILPLEGDRTPVPIIATPFNERSPSFSPDGRWIAYSSDESGRVEVYLQPYPGPGGKVPISIEGGQEPVWCPKGGELYYRNGARVMAVSVETAPTLEVGAPRVLFEGRYLLAPPQGAGQFYDVSSNCQRFLMNANVKGNMAQLHVVLNWFQELERLVPTN